MFLKHISTSGLNAALTLLNPGTLENRPNWYAVTNSGSLPAFTIISNSSYALFQM